ncbi:hypothetical protein QWY16_08865 [Planococcus shenhongbingii]|uniref:hypothetical protein n=1 Tax=Planococcus shenhongbingii TaxID=3058398 RepID=UPI00262E9FD9|nr:hypothetical protein [Planococcus sp. N016]WKA60202.1 hypothetical protein QWY16_08865 [Planococcus sp. N016]
MRIPQKEFTDELKRQIEYTETELQLYLEKWLLRYQPAFLQNYMVLDGGVDKEGTDPFQPDYRSSLVISISDENEELIDLQTIPIWTCERYFFGFPVAQNFPLSQGIGELLDESLEDIQEELQEYIENFLES